MGERICPTAIEYIIVLHNTNQRIALHPLVTCHNWETQTRSGNFRNIVRNKILELYIFCTSSKQSTMPETEPRAVLVKIVGINSGACNVSLTSIDL